MTSVESLSKDIGVSKACDALQLPRSTLYRWRKPKIASAPRPTPSRALALPERQEILEQVHSERFLDQSIPEIHATLLDEGIWLGSMRTMYRVVDAAQEVRERRNVARHPVYTKPQLVARGPNQVWSWDITKIKGPVARTYFHLYVILDIFSRLVVGWMLSLSESAAQASALIEQTCERQKIDRSQLTIHSDRGPSMTSKPVAQLLAELGITRSLSRPHVSNDNSYSESQFKTFKYHPTFPGCFGSIEDGRAHCRNFFDWYNPQHRHSALAWLTPADVHYGRGPAILAARQKTLLAAYHAHPERFPHGPPVVPALHTEVWINRPTIDATVQAAPGAAIATLLDAQGHPIPRPGAADQPPHGTLPIPIVDPSHNRLMLPLLEPAPVQ